MCVCEAYFIAFFFYLRKQLFQQHKKKKECCNTSSARQERKHSNPNSLKIKSFLNKYFPFFIFNLIFCNTQKKDLTLINANLKSLEALSSLRDTTIRSLCKQVHYIKHEANDVLYRYFSFSFSKIRNKVKSFFYSVSKRK